MQTGLSLEGLIREVRSQAERSIDYIVPVTKLQFQEYESPLHDAAGLWIHMEGTRDTVYAPNVWCQHQIAQKLGIPSKYFDRCLAEFPRGLREHLNHWWAKQEEPRMVRTISPGVARAFLGRRYRAMDNYPVLGTLLPLIEAQGLELVSSNVSERNLYIQVVSHRLKGEVEKGDEVQWGLRIRNSEVGASSFEIEELIWRLACKNGMVRESTLKKRHVGRVLDLAEEGNVEFLKDDTLRADDHAFQLKVRDIVEGMLTEGAFRNALGKLQGAAGRKITGDPLTTIEVVQKRYDLSEIETGLVRRNLIAGQNLTAWGLANAVTAVGHEVAYDRAAELEVIGGRIVDLSPAEWSKVAAA